MSPETMAVLHARCFVTPRPWTASDFSDLLATRGVFVAGDAQGFVMGRVILDEAELLTLAVSPDLRRQGRGAALVADFVNDSVRRGAVSAFLEVAADNAAARALYAATGWVRTGCRPRYYRAPDGVRVDAVVMSRPLA